MSYPDRLEMLEREIGRLQDMRVEEARERDRLRSEIRLLRMDNARLRDKVAIMAIGQS